MNIVRYSVVGTAAELTAANPPLRAGEVGFESNTKRTKTGPGFWNALTYDTQGPDAMPRDAAGLTNTEKATFRQNLDWLISLVGNPPGLPGQSLAHNGPPLWTHGSYGNASQPFAVKEVQIGDTALSPWDLTPPVVLGAYVFLPYDPWSGAGVWADNTGQSFFPVIDLDNDDGRTYYGLVCWPGVRINSFFNMSPGDVGSLVKFAAWVDGLVSIGSVFDNSAGDGMDTVLTAMLEGINLTQPQPYSVSTKQLVVDYTVFEPDPVKVAALVTAGWTVDITYTAP